jgi:hypothetical protein
MIIPGDRSVTLRYIRRLQWVLWQTTQILSKPLSGNNMANSIFGNGITSRKEIKKMAMVFRNGSSIFFAPGADLATKDCVQPLWRQGNFCRS